MSCAMRKVEMIRQIVQLRQLIRRWRSLTLRRHHHRPGDADDGSSSGRPVPPGFLAVYVGPGRRRFVIPTRFLKFPVFAALLKEAEEEFGFNCAGGLALPCDVGFFRRVVELLDTDEGRYGALGVDGFLELVNNRAEEEEEGSLDLSTCRDEMGCADRYNGFSPLLQKARV